MSWPWDTISQYWPEDVTEVYRKADVLVWEGHLKQFFLNSGFDPKSLRVAWIKPVKGDPIYVENNPVNPNQLSLIHLIENIYAKQLLPGNQMVRMSEAFIAALQTALCWPKMDFFTLDISTGSRMVSLRTLCQYTLSEAGI